MMTKDVLKEYIIDVVEEKMQEIESGELDLQGKEIWEFLNWSESMYNMYVQDIDKFFEIYFSHDQDFDQ